MKTDELSRLHTGRRVSLLKSLAKIWSEHRGGGSGSRERCRGGDTADSVRRRAHRGLALHRLIVALGMHLGRRANKDAMLISGNELRWTRAFPSRPIARRAITLFSCITRAFNTPYVAELLLLMEKKEKKITTRSQSSTRV
ncbi:unnamed protein product [Trichogramma brassicae]|uniref:Uncharacterized protein n=1 Tax=Trichogramma brassicae TaxID=86971 RepID=A0A6H5J879_9HYME|nr:unnamed protein product [Trichogramma brassicae]